MTVRLRSGAAAAALALAVAGCGTTATSTRGYHFWLVRVKGNYATIYKYPLKNKPGATAHARDLGLVLTRAKESAAARQLNVPMSHITNVGG